MIKIAFIGDKPSKSNTSEYIPFVGAKCFPKLISWIKELNPDYYIVLNSINVSDHIRILALKNTDFKFVALGKNAATWLKTYNIDHFEMPHPSGLNRKLNDEKYVKKTLEECYFYLRSIK